VIAGAPAEWQPGPWEETLALTRVRIWRKPAPAGTGINGANYITKTELGGSMVLIDDLNGAKPQVLPFEIDPYWLRIIPDELNGNTKAPVEPWRIFQALLRWHGLPSAMRRAALHALGLPARDREDAETVLYRILIEQAEARLQAQGHRDKGLRTAALGEVADALGIESKSLQQRIRRASRLK
jgi:hypothetical protein